MPSRIRDVVALPEVSIVVPVFRNADTLRPLHRRLSSVFERVPADLELIFVDDASPDDAVRILRDLAARDARVRALSLKHNIGQHRAILCGLAFSRGKSTVILDADLQDPPEELPRLLAALAAGADAAFGGRRGAYESRDRLLTSHMFKWLQHKLAGVPVDAGTFVAISGLMRRRLLEMSQRFASLVPMIGSAGLPMTSIPVTRAARPVGKSSYAWHGRLASGLRAMLWVLSRAALGRAGAERLYRRNIAEATNVVSEFIGQRFEDRL